MICIVRFYLPNMVVLGLNDVCTISLADFVQPPHKNCMADCILFEREIYFCTIFVSAASWPTWESAHG